MDTTSARVSAAGSSDRRPTGSNSRRLTGTSHIRQKRPDKRYVYDRGAGATEIHARIGDSDSEASRQTIGRPHGLPQSDRD
jgi:hypothetical protein